MDIELNVAVDKDSADYLRLGTNSLWEYIKEDIYRCFGPLAVVVQGRIAYDTYLKEAYVKEFADHEDEKPVLRLLQKFIEEEDIGFYSDIQDWITKKASYIRGLVGHYNDFSPTKWEDRYYPRTLCGKKGSGKTTLLLFAKANIEKHQNVRCLFIRLSSPAFDTDDPISAVRAQIIEQIDQIVSELSKKNGLSENEMIIKWHERLWRRNAIYPDETDLKRGLGDMLLNILFPKSTFGEAARKKRLRDELLLNIHSSKYTSYFAMYLQSSVDLLKDFREDLVIVIDDVDRLDSEETAKSICDRACNLAKQLGDIPVVISIREETMAKLSDVDHGPERISIVPPSFSKVLQKRLAIFSKMFRMKDSQTQKAGYDTDQVKNIVKCIVESVLDTETYANLITYHYDLDILLDIVRCTISSPFIKPEYVLDLHRSDKKIPWHMIFDSMQRFQYRNFYDENSFILNIFDNDRRPANLPNALVRVRLLQVLRYRFQGLVKPIPVGTLYADMGGLGYDKEVVFSALKALARQRFIVTWRMRNAFTEDVVDVLPQCTIVYYLDKLVYAYRYLQNVLPVTPVPFNIPMDIVQAIGPLAGTKLKEVDQLLAEFTDFIRTCEKYEEGHVKNKELFKKVTRGEILSNIMEERLKKEIESMKARKEHINGKE